MSAVASSPLLDVCVTDGRFHSSLFTLSTTKKKKHFVCYCCEKEINRTCCGTLSARRLFLAGARGAGAAGPGLLAFVCKAEEENGSQPHPGGKRKTFRCISSSEVVQPKHRMRVWGCQGQTCESIPLNSRFHNTA